MKKWYLSKTIWGVIITFVGMVAGKELPDLSSDIIEIIGLGLSIYGRFKAEQTIG